MVAQAQSLPKEMHAVHAPNPLGVVLAWELRRYLAWRPNYFIALGAFALLMLGLFFARDQYAIDVAATAGTTTHLIVPITTVGTMANLFGFVSVYLGMFMPFFNADAVACDLHMRTNELLMTTVLPTWAYVWGRYLYGLLLSVGFAILTLPALWLTSLLIQQPPPVFGAMLTWWALFVLCPMVLISNLSVALGTLLPRFANAVKASVIVAWVVNFLSLSPFYMADGRDVWDPTGMSWVSAHVSAAIGHASQQSVPALLAQVQVLPDVSPLIAPHGAFVTLGLLAALITACTFRRFNGPYAR